MGIMLSSLSWVMLSIVNSGSVAWLLLRHIGLACVRAAVGTFLLQAKA